VKLTSVFKSNLFAFSEGKRYIINQGGTSSSKTFSILQLLLIIALKKNNYVISVVSESLPHLKRGAMRDFIKILETEGYYSNETHNKSTSSFNVGSSTVEFFSADDSSKMRGARRDILFINECNNVDKNSFNELSVRTRVTTFLDFNPVGEFWVHEFMQQRKPETFTFIKSTYKNNEHLDEEIIREIESRKDIDPVWWKVFGEGELGYFEGVIITNWSTVNEMPDTPKRVLGLDFGFTNDPTVILDIRYCDGCIYVDEVAYQTKLTNADIGNIIKGDNEINKTLMVCDSAEPKSINELQLMGVRAIPADKGVDSIRNGLDLLKQYKIYVTVRSINLIKELRNYRWKTDKNGKALNVPIDHWNHCIDALRYGAVYLLGSATKTVKPRIHLPK
jgi:phage terminase large subunit